MYDDKKKFIRIPKEQVEEITNSMVEIDLMPSLNEEDEPGKTTFIVVRNTLTRIGHLKNDKIIQSVHILQKKGKYYLCHFKQLFALDGLNSSYNETDQKRLLKIANILDKWALVKVKKRELIEGLEEDPERNVFVNIIPVERIKSGEIVKVKKYNL